MCILFAYDGSMDGDSDYCLIMISNRDEYYDRPAQTMAPWAEDPHIIGGRDLEVSGNNGTWLAVSPLRKKIGVLLNFPGNPKPNAKSRGSIVADFVKNEKSTLEYVEDLRTYAKECNDFIFVSIQLGFAMPAVYSYSNVTNDLVRSIDRYYAFGNNLPHEPLKKVLAGKQQLKDICEKYKKVHMKQNLIEELINLLKSNERHLPDPQLQARRPNLYEQLSSIYVSVPEKRYGTRTHTLLLVTIDGIMDLIEITMLPPIDPNNPKWERTEFQFNVELRNRYKVVN